MNCKQGDLAVFIKSWAKNEGIIVTCVRLATSEDLRKVGYVSDMGAVWVLDREVTASYGPKVALAFDAQLRPIRDNPGQDETLTWAPVSSKEAA